MRRKFRERVLFVEAQKLTREEIEMVRILAAQPWLSVSQLARWARLDASETQSRMRRLCAARLVWAVDAHISRAPEVFYALSTRGIRARAHMNSSESNGTVEPIAPLTRTYYRELLWSLERVASVRDLFIAWKEQGALCEPSVLLRQTFRWRGKMRQLKLLGAARYCDERAGRGIPVAVEWETQEIPMLQRRLGLLLRWQAASAIQSGASLAMPLLIWVTPNADRAGERIELARWRARQEGIPSPWIALTTQPLLAEHGPHARIWYGLYTGETGFLWDGIPRLPAYRVFVLPRPRVSHHLHARLFARRQALELSTTGRDVFPLRLALSFASRRLLWRIALYPALTTAEIGFAAEMAEDEVTPAMETLARCQLIQAHLFAGIPCWLVTPRGLRYLTGEAGFGNAAKRYAMLRGWDAGLARLLRQPEHTRAANTFLLACLREACRRGASFEWQSEVECARVVRWRRGVQPFFPDGLARWQSGDRVWYLALEIERSRREHSRLHLKLKGYVAASEWSGAPWSAAQNLLALVVTTGWVSARRIAEVAAEVSELYFARPLHLWCTTLKLARERGVAERIWRSAAAWETLEPLPMFATQGDNASDAPMPQERRETHTPQMELPISRWEEL